MTYQVEMTKRATKQLNALPADVQQRIRPKVEALANNPRPNGVTKLEGKDNEYRVRVGLYRVVYEIHDNVLLVVVVNIGHRSKVYKD
jgi:mRNA interferase RelE/StbE